MVYLYMNDTLLQYKKFSSEIILNKRQIQINIWPVILKVSPMLFYSTECFRSVWVWVCVCV